MSISSENRKAGPFTGNDVTTTFPFTFKVFQGSDLLVVRQLISTGAETTLVLNTDYTVSLNADQNVSPGGNVILTSALASTYKLTITSAVTNTQPTTLTNNGGFYPSVINNALDRLTILVQQIRERLLRSLSYPVSDPTNIATTLPAAAQRATKVLSFDSDGAPVCTFSATDVQNAQANAAAAQASANAASSSASSAASSASAASSSATAAQNAVNSIMWRDVVFVSTNTTIDNTYRGKLVVVDATSGVVTITLPQISGLDLSSPFSVGVKKSDASGNAVNVVRSGSDTIDGSTSKSIVVTGSGSTFVPDIDPSPDQWTALDFGATAGNMVVDTFSGNGSTTGFTLSVNPGSINNTQVFVSGVYQAKSTYSLAGTTLTFSAAPPAGTNNIQVVSGTTLSIGVPSDGTVSTTKLADASVTNVKMANMSQATVKGRASGAGTGVPTDLTAQQVKDIVSTFPTIQRFTSTGSITGYLFTVTAANATVGATYTNNSQTFTVLATIAGGTQLFCSSTGAPTASGTLTRATGSGDATITFSANQGLATYTTPANAKYLKVKMVGGGGGGGGGAASGAAGGNGGITAFGASFLVANGGSGGGGSGNLGGTGGSATVSSGTPNFALTGAIGGGGSGSLATGIAGGIGAATPLSGGGGGGSAISGPGSSAIANTGAGGGGGAGTSGGGSGGGGGAGGYIEMFITSPSATYVYSIGSGGTAGSGGSAGGAGGSGVIVVEEYYV